MSAGPKKLTPIRTRKYLNKDFQSLRADLLEYARTYYPDKIQDFSESSLGGLFLDLAAYVGDVTSFYLDHQFGELNIETAVEQINIERQLRNSGVKITGAAPAVVSMTFYCEIPAVKVGSDFFPKESALPIIEAGTVITSNSGIDFELFEDLDFSKKWPDGQYVARRDIGSATSSGAPVTYVMSMTGACISGKRAKQIFSFGNEFIPFRTATLSNENITDIIAVYDAQGNEYYEVESLAQDTAFSAIENISMDEMYVKDVLKVVPAPYRFTREMSLDTKLVTLRFGGGTGATINASALPEPSNFSVPLYGKKTFGRFSLDPTQLLSTNTLGIAPVNTNVTVEYRYGGGLSHNVSSGTIRTITSLKISFPKMESTNEVIAVRSTVEAINESPAAGGEDAPTLDDLKARVPAFRNSQSRIVTREDLIARVYTLPSNFGRVFRAGLHSDKQNPLSTQLFIISRDNNKRLITSPDTLKLNLRTYLNEFRLISDAIEILDAKPINLGLEFSIVVDPNAHPKSVLLNVLAKLKDYFDTENWQIDQPISISEVTNVIYNNNGVMSVTSVNFKSLVDTIADRVYSGNNFDVATSTKRGMIVPPPGSMFEIRYPDFDLIGKIQ